MCRAILDELPDWFGMPEAIDEYVASAEHSLMFGYICEQTVGGFVLLEHTSEAACEIKVIAVRPALHRRGIGRHLADAAAAYAKSCGRHYLTVKTLGPSRPDVGYELTRRFYAAIGFEAIEELRGVWKDTPCLLMIKAL